MKRQILSLGYASTEDFILKLAIPIIGISVIMFFISLFLLSVPFFVPYLFIIAGLGYIAGYPYMIFERKKVSIHEQIHLFITYAGTISTVHIDTTTMFKKIAHEKKYGEISESCEKILYLAKGWNIGFAKSCRKIGALSPSRIFGDFLDRMAAVLDFGEELELFLVEEQDAVMDDYTNEYMQSLNNITMLKEVFIAITLSTAFGMSAALLLPLVMGVSMTVVVKYALMALFMIDIMMVLLIKMFIPKDSLCHNLPIKDEGTKKVEKWFFIILPISILLVGIMLFINKLPFLVNIAVGLTPLLVVGYFAMEEEEMVFKRDKAFPTFIRAVGGTIEVRQGAVVSSLGALRVHDFGVLNDMLINLFRRLRLASDKMKSWLYFAGETGSMLITYFITIFAEVSYLGGNLEKGAEIISKNFTKLISLRKLRVQQAAGLRGALYGALVGFVATIYISTSITQLLTNMFSTALSQTQLEGRLSNLVSTILPPIPEMNMGEVNVYIGVIVLLHSLISALILKFVDGGNMYASLFDFIIMLWLGAILSWIVPHFSLGLFGGMLSAG